MLLPYMFSDSDSTFPFTGFSFTVTSYVFLLPNPDNKDEPFFFNETVTFVLPVLLGITVRVFPFLSTVTVSLSAVASFISPPASISFVSPINVSIRSAGADSLLPRIFASMMAHKKNAAISIIISTTFFLVINYCSFRSVCAILVTDEIRFLLLHTVHIRRL